MAKNHGRFIATNLLNQELEMFIHLDSEWINYSDGDSQSYTILVATPIAYDQDSGILTLQNTAGQKFYIGEEFVEAFWTTASGFSLAKNTTSTVRPNGLRNKKRDIM